MGQQVEVAMRGIFGGARAKAAMAAIGTFCAMAIFAGSAQAAAPLIEGTTVANVTSTAAVLEAKINPQGEATRYRFEYGLEDCSVSSCTSAPVKEGKILAGSSPVLVEVPITGLQPKTTYHFRAVAKNSVETVGPDRVFVTFGQTLSGLPDGRAYEQTSPLNKDGGDAQGWLALVKATPSGDGMTFGSPFGIPGGKGSQELPTYLGSRGTSDWSTVGLLPPPSVGERSRMIGWSPDFSRIYSSAIRLNIPPTEGLVSQPRQGGPPTVIGPYAAGANYSFAGESPDGSVVFFEAMAKLPPKEGGTPIAAATAGVPNLYAWDAESREVHLVGTFNTGEGAPKGSFAGPYDWSLGTNAFDLREGGGQRNYYLRDMRAITPSGDVYFTAAGTAQLYLRRNPTKAQSPLNGEGRCANLELACTIHVSASERTPPDTAGEQPAAFQAASQDGSKVFFTSSEKLTNNANTGLEQPPAEIARDTIDGNVANIKKELILKRAVGVARFGPWIYWANPSAGTIGRAKLNGEEEVEAGTIDTEFITPPPSEGKCEEEVKPGVFKPIAGPIPSEPRYLAVDSEYVYWTNSGLREEVGTPRDGGGTIGRAKLNGETVEDIEPAFICGEEASQQGKRLVSNPQGIAVNSEHIYWANAAQDIARRTISRSAIGGSAVEEVKEAFVDPSAGWAPYGLALDATHLYFSVNNEVSNDGFVSRVPLAGGAEDAHFVGEAGIRGVALDSEHLYWATQGEGGAIGRSDLELENVEKSFIDIEGAPNGLAATATHLFWSANGDTSGNPGNDLYRYQPPVGAGNPTLSDLTPLATGNGAEVQGVLGASADGSYLYFAANGALAAGASQGTCKGAVKEPSGKCNLYAWHEGQLSFVARLDVNGNSDALNWVGTPFRVFNTGSYLVKTAFLGAGGAVLVFRSKEKLTDYDNEGVPEFYRYRASEPGKLSCLTCPPSRAAAGAGPRLGSVIFPSITPASLVQAVSARNLSADGSRFFFETPEALSPEDTNGAAGCPTTGGVQQNYPACLDVYEWEAPNTATGQCKEGAPSYSPVNNGCLYLISTGKSPFPSLFGDASESGNDVFFFTRQRLVGQDEDELQDVYDARIGGGLAAQNQVFPPPCESAESCHGPAQSPPAEGSPATPNFVGPVNPKPKHKKQKAKKKKHKAKKQKTQKKQAAKAKQRSAR